MLAAMSITPAEFWARVDRRGSDECWEWQGARKTNRHGVKTYGHFNDHGTMVLAHRYVCALEIADPTGHFVLHSCDNPPCCNPAHLRVGTALDNARDRDSRGRHRVLRGEDHPRSTLTAAQAREIRERYAAGGVSFWKLAGDYGVSEQPILSVLHGVTHADAGGPAMPAKRAPNAKLSLADYEVIRERKSAGESNPAIARDFGVHPGTIKRIWAAR
jgi:hypothetical protein